MEAIEAYIEQVDEGRREAFEHLFETVKDNLPAGFELTMTYNMISFVVPLTTYPEGYLGRVDEPVPFISLAAQKQHLSLYHMGLMGNRDLLEWFQDEYAKVVPTKLNMGKSCLRFTNVKTIPYELIGNLVSKISLAEWVSQYETFLLKRSQKK